MDIDQTMRIILIGGFAVVAPIGIYHRVKAASSGDKIDRKEEGALILSVLRPVALLHLLGMFAFMINPSWMNWSRLELPDAARWAGVGFMALFGLLVVWTLRTLGKNITDTVVIRKEHELVTSGPYKLVRHPLYLAAFFAVLGNTLAVSNWFLFVTGAIVLSMIVMRTKKEEEKLVAHFGDDYREFMRTRGRFFPRLFAR